MSDAQLLFAVLVALYLWECACWLRRGGLAFTTGLGRIWQARQPGNLIANQAGGFVLAFPLPPLGTLFVANQFPLSLSPASVLGFVASNVNPGWRPTQTGRFFRYEEIQTVRARGRRLLVNGELLATHATAELARRGADLIKRLSQLKPAQREAAIADFNRDYLDGGTVEKRRKEFNEHAGALRMLSNAVVVYVFLLVPAVIWNLGLKLSWLGLLLGLLALTCGTAFRFARAHRALYPQAEDDRFTHTLTILLAPTSAMRALDALSRPLFEEFHPLAPAKVLLPEAEFRDFARRVWLDLQNPALPLCPNDQPAARETELHSRRALITAAEQLLKQSGLSPEELSRPPQPGEATSRAFCPRCHAQFTTPTGQCADCGGLPLVAFAATVAGSRPA